MSSFVADTHALFWYLTNSSSLGAKAKKVFDEADEGKSSIFIPAIVLAELYYLNVKLWAQVNFSEKFQELESNRNFILLAFEPGEVLDLDRDFAVPEMHDRLIAGVSRRLNAPCITKDQRITDSNLVETIW